MGESTVKRTWYKKSGGTRHQREREWQRKRESVAAFLNSDFDWRGIYSCNWQKKKNLYESSIHLWPDIGDNSCCYRSHHGTPDDSTDMFTCSIISGDLEPCLKKVKQILFSFIYVERGTTKSYSTAVTERKTKLCRKTKVVYWFITWADAFSMWFCCTLARCSKQSSLHSVNTWNIVMMTRHSRIKCKPGKTCKQFLPLFCIRFRISLQKMPSIRETLREMGVSVEQLLTELAQKSTDDPNNGTVPTPLTNYLDVRHFYVTLI